MFSMILVGSGSVSFYSDSGSSHFFLRIRIQGNDTDSTDPDTDPQHCPVETSWNIQQMVQQIRARIWELEQRWYWYSRKDLESRSWNLNGQLEKSSNLGAEIQIVQQKRTEIWELGSIMVQYERDLTLYDLLE